MVAAKILNDIGMTNTPNTGQLKLSDQKQTPTMLGRDGASKAFEWQITLTLVTDQWSASKQTPTWCQQRF